MQELQDQSQATSNASPLGNNNYEDEGDETFEAVGGLFGEEEWVKRFWRAKLAHSLEVISVLSQSQPADLSSALSGVCSFFVIDNKADMGC